MVYAHRAINIKSHSTSAFVSFRAVLNLLTKQTSIINTANPKEVRVSCLGKIPTRAAAPLLLLHRQHNLALSPARLLNNGPVRVRSLLDRDTRAHHRPQRTALQPGLDRSMRLLNFRRRAFR